MFLNEGGKKDKICDEDQSEHKYYGLITFIELTPEKQDICFLSAGYN